MTQDSHKSTSPIIDGQVFPGTSLFGSSLTPEDLERSMNRLGIQRAVVIPPKPKGYHYGPANKILHNLVSASDDRLIQFCRVDPWQENKAVQELMVCLKQYHCQGLFLHPREENIPVNHDHVRNIVRKAADFSLPVMLAGGHEHVSRAYQVADLVRDFPDVHFIVTSGGQINISGAHLQEAENLFREHPNTFLETSGIYREDFIEDMARTIGPERIIFGSASPIYDQDYELKRIQWAHVEEEIKTLILGKNLFELLS